MCIYYDKMIYVMGGRTYGEDELAILDNCERYDFETNKWEWIAPM